MHRRRTFRPCVVWMLSSTCLFCAQVRHFRPLYRGAPRVMTRLSEGTTRSKKWWFRSRSVGILGPWHLSKLGSNTTFVHSYGTSAISIGLYRAFCTQVRDFRPLYRGAPRVMTRLSEGTTRSKSGGFVRGVSTSWDLANSLN